MFIRLWHRPHNGGWIWFDRNQIKRFSAGFGLKDYKYTHLNNGKPEIERILWWCLFGFCGRIALQSWPWNSRP